MIHFNENLSNKVMLMHSVKEFADEFNDLSKIKYLINKPLLTQYDIEEVKRLDNELYQKNPEIMYLLKVAKDMKKVNFLPRNNYVLREPQIENLIQDKFGIYAHFLLKSNNIKDVKDFID